MPSTFEVTKNCQADLRADLVALAPDIVVFSLPPTLPLNDQAVAECLLAVTQLCQSSLECHDVVPAARSVTLYLRDANRCQYWQSRLAQEWQTLEVANTLCQVHRIAVKYGGQFGPDLIPLAERLGLSCQDVIRLHSQTEYRVGFMGFLPGFGYLQGLAAQLHVPRLASPRTHVAAGSVAIAGKLSAIYPSSSPGGWHILGRTEQNLFNHRQSSPCLFNPGDRVVFEVSR
ncbi:5-oxoprolinase subunit PxpB [Pseudoalteromonas fenneropenaei]|uniref:5-oxoprolinase subunit PxpB n=1 Tax=Pseudoalteromonas fenneropenaei TaxID=1737459 RepID=A0ABV7CHI0_9GAMM